MFAYRTFFTVKETEFALVTQFGRPLYAVNAAGLHVKWAFQSATYFDRRLRIVEAEYADRADEATGMNRAGPGWSYNP